MQRILTAIGIWLGILNSYATVWTDCSEAFFEKDVHLKVGKLAARDLTLESKSGKVKLEAGKDEDFYHHYHKSSGLITASVDDEGHDRTTSKPVEILAQTVTIPSPAEIDYKVGLGKEFREALAGRTDIDWKVVQDHYREWSEHTTTLSGPARMLVACVLSVVTQGMGTSQWLAGHGIAEGTATNAALRSGIQTLAASAGTALATNLGDFSKAFDELTSTAALKNFASTMLTAGISQSVSTSLQLPDEPKTFTDSLKTNTAHGLVRTGVDSAINGGKVGKNLAQTMTSAAVDASSAQIAHGIGNAKATGALNQVTHKAAHGALAVTGAKLTGRDPVGAVIGAVVAETAAEAMDKPGASQEARQKIAQKARIIGDTVAFVAGRDVASADKAGSNAVENNFIAHPEASMKIAIAVRDESLSEEERSQKIEEALDYAKTENKVYMTTAAATLAPTITAGYFATESAAHWAGTYAGGGIEAVQQEFREHPILSTLDVAATGMLGAGFAKNLTKSASQMVEISQNAYKHHKVVGQLRSNVKQGKLFEEKELIKNVLENGGGETQVTVKVQGGTKVRLDYIFKNPYFPEKIIIKEFKSSPIAPLTKNQKIAYPLIEQSGATVVGKGKGTFVPGLSLPPTRIEIIRPKK